MSVIFETSLGDLTIDLFLEDAPQTCLNFLKLCKLKYYDHCLFHNIQKDFTVQCGDPTGTGEGGTSVFGILNGEKQRFFKDEISPNLKHEKKGIVAMASAGKDMNGSQFYITTTSRLPRLDGQHTIFGEVVEGLETLDKINEAVVTLEGRPVQVLRIQHTIVLEDPFPDPQGLRPPDRSPSPPRRWPEGMLPEELAGLDEDDESRRAHLAAQAAQAKAEALVLMGELPDADVRPPDNILFVCKLNPTTTGPSLSIPFSRFGKILSSEVIKDRHGNSLCYAFIEFALRESCEEAYLKMQNVLIDGRRIHVDFCQSVSKVEGFRAAGGWKSFFADRARGFNTDLGSSQSGNLQFKRGGQGPLSFSSSSQGPRHSEDRGSGDFRARQSEGYRRYPDQRRRDDYRVGDERKSYSSRDHRDSRERRDYQDQDSYDRRGYHDRDDQSDRNRKRPGSPLEDEDGHKRPRYQ